MSSSHRVGTVSGFSFIRNAVRFDYPFVESISSLLPLCDEVVIAVGRSDDDTLERLLAMNSDKIKIIETVWNDSLRSGGAVLAEQTDIALSHITGDWGIYLQADEVLHEEDYPTIREALERYRDDRRIEGLLFEYKHFYGSYRYVGNSRRWYRREVRIIRNGIGVRSWGDAQGFRIGGRKMRVKLIDASIYHYGWVKPPEIQQAKQRSFNRLWHSDEWVERHVGASTTFDYSKGGKLAPFTGSHPAVMKERVEAENWTFDYNPANVRTPLVERALNWFEGRTGIRIGEYRNYTLV